MIYGIGTDIVETKRIDEALLRHEDKFLNKIFSQEEIDYCKNKINPEIYYSARFSAKEAFLKAIGTGLNGEIVLKDIEIVKNKKGKPSIKQNNKLKNFFKKNSIEQCHLSISHTASYATAVVVLETKKEF